MHKLLGYTAAKSPCRTSLSESVRACSSPAAEERIECLDCDSPAPKPTYKISRIRLQQCDACGAMICSKQTLVRIFHHFGSSFGHLKPCALNRQQKNLQVLEEANRIDRKKGIACFLLDELDALLEKMSVRAVEKIAKKWWYLGRR